jgi:hypothetical protein
MDLFLRDSWPESLAKSILYFGKYTSVTYSPDRIFFEIVMPKYEEESKSNLNMAIIYFEIVMPKYEEESKSNLNMAVKSQNHVVDGCTTDMLCPPA